MRGEQFPQSRGLVSTKHNLCVEIRGVDLAYEFAASSARRKRIKLSALVAPHCDNLGDAVFSSSNHGCYCGVLSAEPGTRAGVDTHAHVLSALISDQRGGNITEKAITNTVGPEPPTG
ncbi:MAG: hypothetical protein ABIS84_09640 [Arachnia sp.]